MIWLLLVAVGLLVIMYATIVLIEGWASDRLRGIICFGARASSYWGRDLAVS